MGGVRGVTSAHQMARCHMMRQNIKMGVLSCHVQNEGALRYTGHKTCEEICTSPLATFVRPRSYMLLRANSNGYVWAPVKLCTL